MMKFRLKSYVEKDFYKVITVTEKYLSPKPWFTEMGHVVPSHGIKIVILILSR